MRILKYIGFLLLLAITVAACYIGYLYFQNIGKFPVDEEAFPHRIGYLEPGEGVNPDGFKLCSEDFQIGWHNSAAPLVYKGTKYAFRTLITENYENRGYSDSGFLNLRFHINCEGRVGNIIVNEIDKNYKTTNLDDDMVAQLVNLSIQEDNWETISYNNKSRDLYMYLIFKIENGEVLEILP